MAEACLAAGIGSGPRRRRLRLALPGDQRLAPRATRLDHRAQAGMGGEEGLALLRRRATECLALFEPDTRPRIGARKGLFLASAGLARLDHRRGARMHFGETRP